MQPSLRFKKFQSHYVTCKLEDLGVIERGRFTPRPRNDPQFFIGGEIPFVQTGDIVSAPLYIEKYTQFINEKGLKVSKQFPTNTVFVTIAANIGDTAIAKEPVACTDSVVAIKTNPSKTTPLWLKYFLDTKKGELDSNASQNAQKNINLQVLKPLKVNLPVIEEQIKIASFLSAVDEKISQLSKKHELLNQYKKGVMQKIFSQKLRFKADDGSNYPDWEFSSFNNLFFLANDKSSQIMSSKYLSSGVVPIVDQGKSVISGWTNSTKIFNNLPVIIFGDHTRIIKWVDFEFCQGADGTQLIKTIDMLLPKFGYYLLSNVKLPNLGYSRHLKELKQTNFAFPKSVLEQSQISSFLSALDEKIQNTQYQLEATKQYKQGLLQQMFV